MKYEKLTTYTKVAASIALHHLPYLTKPIFKLVEFARNEKEFKRNVIKFLKEKVKAHKKAIQHIRGGGM